MLLWNKFINVTISSLTVGENNWFSLFYVTVLIGVKSCVILDNKDVIIEVITFLLSDWRIGFGQRGSVFSCRHSYVKFTYEYRLFLSLI